MDVAAFQSIYPEEVRIQSGRAAWIGQDLQFYDPQNETWLNLASGGEAMMFQDKLMNFETIDGLVKSSIVAGNEFAIIIEKNLLGFVRGKNIQTNEDEEMNIEIDWDCKVGSTNISDFEVSDIFNQEEDLKRLL